MSSQCPVDHSKFTVEQLKAAAEAHKGMPIQPPSPPLSSSPSSSSSSCPVSVPSPLACSSDTFSPSPAPASIVGDNFPSDSTLHPDQRVPLSRAPLASSIPRGGFDDSGRPHDHWIFPSPQRFYNAMKKKGWSPNEQDVPAIVSIHNTVNEQCWRKIMKYEEFHFSECSKPKLLKFKALPGELSPKARVLTLFGYIPPFDRHDWTVDRCGKEVRYILDFYEGTPVPGFPASFHLDVRPEISPGGIIDRTRMFMKEWL
jgi:cytochrome c heme-lyase